MKCSKLSWKIYYGTIKSHSIMKNIGQIQNRKEYWRFKEFKAQPQLQLYILKRRRSTKKTGICYLCLNEKLFIIEHQGNDFPN